MSDTKPKQILRERILARFDLTDKEMRDYGAEVGRVNAEYNRLEDELASVKSDYKSRLDAKDAQRNTLSTKLANGYEMREVEAIVEFDVSAGKKKYIHPKTKNTLRETDMTHADWQLPMFSKEELAKARGMKPEEQKPPTEEPGKTNVGNAVDQAIIEAANQQTKVEVDLEEMIEAGSTAKDLPAAFKAKAIDVANWPKNVATAVAKMAKEKVSEGTGTVIEFLKPFTVAN